MIDGFVLSHPSIVFTRDWTFIHNTTFEEVRRICNDRTLVSVPLDWFAARAYAHTQAMSVELHLEAYLSSMGMYKRCRLDRLLLEVVVLHRLKGMQERWKDISKASLRVVTLIGTMIQHRLTQLLLSVDVRQYGRIFGLSKLPLLTTMRWEQEFVGASAVARVIKDFNQFDEAMIRLPTVGEDLDDGIDLFVETPQDNNSGSKEPVHLAVSIKSVNRPERIRAEQLLNSPTAFTEDPIGLQRKRIIEGARVVSRTYERLFVPVRIEVGRPANTAYELSIDELELDLLEELLDQIDYTLRLHRLHLAAA